QESDADQILEPGLGRDKYISEEKRRALYPANKDFKEIQLADWHGHSWNYQNVYKMDRRGNLQDADGNIVSHSDPDKFKKAVHLKDIHFEKGMHCIDCHTEQDVHGDGRIWGAMIDAIEIRCEDCHGTPLEKATLITSGVAASGQNDLSDRRRGAKTPFGQRVFEWRRGKLIQRSKIDENLQWEVPQLAETGDPQNPNYNAKASRAHTLQNDGVTWGRLNIVRNQLAHSSDKMECYTCHSAWNTQCYGCHLSAEVNRKQEAKHYEGGATRAEVHYSPQVLRADAFQIGINGTSKGNKYSPMRSASAVLVTVRARNRQVLVHQQPTISASGHSGFAVTPNPPHTVRKRETRECSDCHISANNDNNAWLAGAYGLGTNATNFVGEYAWVAEGSKGVQAVKVTEGWEPQPVIGSRFQEILYPESFRKFVGNNRQLKTAYSAGTKNARSIAARGEWLFIADGPGGFKVYDRANIGNKNVAQRIVAKQNSGFGQTTSISTRDATCVALPSNTPMNVDRSMPQFRERPVAELFRYAYITDRVEGLIIVDVQTFHDNNPQNNRIRRAVTYNPNNRLTGAVKIEIAGNYAYIMSETTGFHVVDISNPLAPNWLASIDSPDIIEGRSLNVQFRYAFVVDKEGFKAIDITDPETPSLVPDSYIRFTDARDVYAVRMYAYVSAGSEGIGIIDIEKPDDPKLIEKYSANGQLNDSNSLTTGTVNASTFAFVADGRNGLRVIRLIGPPDTPGHLGFSPKPVPKLIATYRTKGPALAIAEGAKRDRSTDESGNQIGVSGQLGSYPLDKEKLEKLLRRDGKIYKVSDN
ncbi:hypothetical protein MJD09_25145, partial [bacterium]|nr:hypothetical protein [bacterium]